MGNKQKVWLRAGVAVFLTPEDVNKVFASQDESAIVSALKEGRFQFDGDSYIPGPVVAQFNQEQGTHFEAQDMDIELPILHGGRCVPSQEEMDFKYLLERDRKAREVFAQLQDEDNMCKIAESIDSLDEEMAKTVLKLFVYAK